MNVLIVGNPIASGGSAEERIRRLTEILERRGHRVESYLTRFAGDGRAFVSTIGPGVDRVVIVGGDGTFNEILNGIPDDFSVPLLQLPTGNANLLGRDLSLPQTARGAANLLENGRVIRADVAVMNGIKFIMVAGAGFDARATEELKKVRKGKVSNFSYVLPLFRALRKRSGEPFSVVVDGKAPVTGAAVLVCNTRTYGGICEIAFDAGIDTRRLDIVVLPEEGLWPLIKVFAAAKFSRVTRIRGVQYLQGNRIEISSHTPIPMQVDGDFAGRYPQVVITLRPGCLSLVIP